MKTLSCLFLLVCSLLHAGASELLQKQIEQIAADSKGRLGVKAVLLETGESVSLNPQAQFPMQSVYKVPIAMAVLRKVDAGELALRRKVAVRKENYVAKPQHSPMRDRFPDGGSFSLRELLALAVSQSDGSASDVLLNLAGGPKEVMAYLASINVDGVIVANSEKEIGSDSQTQYRNWASPDGAVSLLRALHKGTANLSEDSRALLLALMTETPTGPNRLKGLLPGGTIVAHKTGTSGTKDGITAATNDIGLITTPSGKRIAIAVFLSDAPGDDAARDRIIARVAKAAWDAWGK